MRKNTKKYTVRATTAALYTLFLVGSYQNCSVYQYEPETGVNNSSSVNDDSNSDNNDDDTNNNTNDDDTTTNTNDVTDTTSDTNSHACLIQNLEDGGTKRAINHSFKWNVLENECIVQVKINDSSWKTCSHAANHGCNIINNQYTLKISQYGTSKVIVRTLVSSGELRDTDKVSVTLERPHICDSYQECMNKNQSRRRDCDCEPTELFGDNTSPGALSLDEMCYELRCGHEF